MCRMCPGSTPNDIANHEPLYRTIADELREQIESGLVIPGEQIATEQEISREYQVSRITARNAVKELEQQGLVVRIRGKGTFVSDQAESIADSGGKSRHELAILSVVLPIGRHAGHDTLSTIEGSARERGFHVTFHNSLFDPKHEREIVEQVVDGGSRGLIVYPCIGIANLSLYSRLLIEQFPLVFVDRAVDGITVPTVRCDNYGGFRSITNHVLASGHRRIAFFGNQPSSLESERERLRGFCDACVAEGVPVRDEYVVATAEHEHEMSEPGGPGRSGSGISAIARSLERLLSLSSPPSCIMAVNDVTAFHLYKAASRLGAEVGTELSVTGFDDLEMGAHLHVPLTTVLQPFETVGRSATEMLFAMIDGQKVVPDVTIPTQLVVRDSVSHIQPE